MRTKVSFLITIATLMFGLEAYGYRNDPANSHATVQTIEEKTTSAGCLPPSTSAQLNVNNVRALIHSGGDMWWDLISNAQYEIPKGSGRHSLYVGNLWVAGRESQTQTLKVAAQRYRSNGVDFWTGPLDSLGAGAIDAETCELYDQIWSISRAEVEKFIHCGCTTSTDAECEGYTIPQSILEWPGNPIPQANGQHEVMQHILAPFHDANGNGIYEPTQCEYPKYDMSSNGNKNCRQDRSAWLYGDFTLWWVFNDKGNIHGETGSTPIGMEVRAQAFGFNTNDEINNMTFYNYQLINRGTTTLEQCYFGVNTDADIGGPRDDYTGCDVERGFGFMYNGDDLDLPSDGALGYGENPPAIGIDFFLGPYLDSNGVAEFWDKTWNSPANTPQFAKDAILALEDTSRHSIAFGINGVGFNDTIKDNERFGMRRFVYYNNGDDPVTGGDYYNLLRGYWPVNAGGGRMVYGGNGQPEGAFQFADHADFMFPGNSDPLNWGTKGISQTFAWSELNVDGSGANTKPADRRFVQSAGPFTLLPGAVNDITTGVVWARANSGNSYESVLKVLAADIKAQSLFENCFKVLDGPDAPDLNIQELDQELVMYLTNKPGTNNYLNQYEEENYFISEYRLTSVTHDTTVWIPHFDSLNVSGIPYYVYGEEQDSTADTLFVMYLGVTPVDTMFGYNSNQSELINTTVQTGELDTTYNDRMIRFEGYLIYQVKNITVTATDIFGPDGSEFGRLVAQCDVKNFDANGNPIGKLVNFEYNDALGYSVPIVKVDGANQGIKHSFKVTQDEFSTSSSKTLVNHKEYYYMALAYGYNNYKTYIPDDADAIDGQKEPFFLGRKNTKVYKAIPHITSPENGGTILNSLYGFGPKITRIEGRGNGGNILELTKETEEAILSSPEHRSKLLTYENGLGPVNIKIIDPLAIKGKKYILKVLDTTNQAVKTVQGSATWILLDPSTDPGEDSLVAVSDKDISGPYEQIIYDRRDGTFLGFSIDLHQVQKCGPTWTYANQSVDAHYVDPGSVEINGTEISTPGNGLLYTKIDFENPENFYLGFFQDLDGNTPLNWVRQGSTDDADVPHWNSNYLPAPSSLKVFFDPQGKFVTGTSFYGGGGIVPYVLTCGIPQYEMFPGSGVYLPTHNIGHRQAISNYIGATTNRVGEIYDDIAALHLGSVDIVITPDKSKWSRCPVIETGITLPGNTNSDLIYDPGFPVSDVPNNLDLRFSFSVDKEGQKNYSTVISTNPDDPNYKAPFGMGWFPGYAIDVETGERLNIAFGEDSGLPGENGRDMLFNPSQSDPAAGNNTGYISPLGDYLFAGKHYIYIFQSNPIYAGSTVEFPNYDEGTHLMKLFCDPGTPNLVPIKGVGDANARKIWYNCIWAGIPFNVAGKNWLGGECRIRLRVQKPYQKGYSASKSESSPTNFNNPQYEFSFEGMEGTVDNHYTATSALDLIQVVPNPYYASSEYETNALDNKVKIVNLPDECDISIYTLNGTLIRRYIKRSNTTTSVDWDLKNFKNIPISTGLYIIHVNAPGIGEKILKWYGVIRPINVENY